MTEKRLLIVDDDRSILAALRMIFDGKYDVVTAENGSEALSIVSDSAPDLVVLDVGLPDTNGLDLLDQIKSLAPETVVIMMTAAEETKLINRAFELGAHDYLVKPIDARVLKTTLQSAFNETRSTGAILPPILR